jgi:glycerophosphoryl diester phosphodiesterase
MSRPAAPLVPTPSVAGHRGASGQRPEHTLEAFALALAMGVDDLELDLVATRDGHLVVRHDTELSLTTDVAARPDLAHRRTTQVVDGAVVDGWFVDSLTLAELRTLRARERLPRSRPVSAVHDGRAGVATLDDVIRLVDDWCASTGRRAGLLLELKHVAHLRAGGLPIEELVLDALRRHGLDHDRARVQVMAFEPEPLRRLARTARVPLLQLVRAPDQVTARALGQVAAYADGIGCAKHLLLGDRGGRVVRDAHRRWLTVHAWTLAAENRFLAPAFRVGSDPDLLGDLAGEARFLLELGVDGLISDHPDEVVVARDRWLARGFAHAVH